jgi:hypothetical protein
MGENEISENLFATTEYTHITPKGVPINDAPSPQKQAYIRGGIASFFGLI